jgi:2-polyprenyl-3-methyl-5-hydroxy-6-metoxy-1,4-benzoquinol methylase
MSNYYDGLNLKLLAAIPAGAARVLELGCANGLLGRRYKELNPGSQWWGVDVSPQAAAVASTHLDRVLNLDLDRDGLDALGEGYDVIVIGDLLEHLREPARVLEALYDRSAARAKIVCCVPNMSHVSVIERLIGGDIAYDDAGLLDRTHSKFFSQASAFKTFLDAGWLPSLQDQYRAEPGAGRFTASLLEAAAAMGIPHETAQRNLGLYQMIIVCEKWQMQALARPAAPVPFSVIVAVNRPWQFALNTARSPGLREVQADVVPVEGAASAASAFEAGAARTRHAWRLFAHQDVYFPVGTGFALAQQLGELERMGYAGAPVGVAGLQPEPGGRGVSYAGMVIDRIKLFDHGPASNAVSIDELAVALHRDTPLAIDAALGWHLWATDLCLQARRLAGGAIGQVLSVPLFHNSVSTWTLPRQFQDSADILLDKYPELAAIPTLCGLLARRPAPQPAIA